MTECSLGDIPPGGRRGDFLYQFDPTVVQPAVVADGAGGQALGGAPFEVFVGGDAVTLAYTPLVLGPGLIAFGTDYIYAPSFDVIPAETYRLGLGDGIPRPFVGNAAGLDPAGGSFFLGVIVDPASVFTQVSLFSVQTDPTFLVPAYQADNLIYAAAVPEPTTIWMLALGIILLLPLARWYQEHSAPVTPGAGHSARARRLDVPHCDATRAGKATRQRTRAPRARRAVAIRPETYTQ